MINLPAFYLKCHNFTRSSMGFAPLFATLILIDMNFPEKELSLGVATDFLDFESSDTLG